MSGSGTDSSRWAGLTAGLAVRHAVLAAMIAAAGVACSDQSAQLETISDSFHAQLETKDMELQALRDSEAMLQSELSNLQGRMEEMQRQMSNGEVQGGAVDVKELAAALEPIIEAKVESSLKATLSGVQLLQSSSTNESSTQSTQQQDSADGGQGTVGGKQQATRDGKTVDRFLFFFPEK